MSTTKVHQRGKCWQVWQRGGYSECLRRIHPCCLPIPARGASFSPASNQRSAERYRHAGRRVIIRLVLTQDFGRVITGSVIIGGRVATEPVSILHIHTLTHIGALNRWQAKQDNLGPLPRKTTGMGVRNGVCLCVYIKHLCVCICNSFASGFWMPLKEISLSH